MKKIFNLLPGPSSYIDKFKKYLFKTPISQRDEEFLFYWYQIKDKLKLLIDNPYGKIAILTSSATGAMEASIVSLVKRNSKVLVISAGKFGDRFYEILKNYSINTKRLSFFEDRKIDYNKIEEELKSGNYTHITYQICETSSGIFTDPEKISQLAKKYSLFTIADGVSAFLSEYIYQEKNNIDALILGSQKGFNAPAGISFVSLGLRAINQIKDLDISSYYFDLNKYLFVPPFTPAINTIFYIYNFLKKIEKINLLNIIERNRQIALKIRNFCLKFNINQYSLEPSSAISVFEYEKSKQFIEFCKNNYRLYIGTGQGILKDKVFRIGHLGLTPLKYYNIFQIALNKFIKINSRMKI